MQLSVARETGFEMASASSSISLAVVMAHASRIWHVRFGSGWTDREITLFSFGEDTHTQEWRLSLDGRFTHVTTLSGHVGKNIWAAAVLPGIDTTPPRVATGAADGKICLFRGQSNAQDTPAVTVAALPETQTLPPKRREVFHSYAFLSTRHLLAATSHGRLFLGSIQAAPATCDWTSVELPESLPADIFCDYNVVQSPGNDDSEVAVVGTARGQLCLYSPASGLQPLATVAAGKIDDVFFVKDGDRAASSGHLQLVVSVLFRNEATALVVDITVDQGRIVAEKSSSLPFPGQSRPASITAAGLCCGHVVLGSRRGQLLVYQADGHHYSLATQLQTDTRDAILSVVPLPPCARRPWSSCSAFVATARDGTYRIFSLETTLPKTPTLRLRHETATPFGPIVCDAAFLSSADEQSAPHLLLCGFRGTHFVVWDESRQTQLAAVECGSAHRVHTCLLARSGAVGFAFTRGGRLHVLVQPAGVGPAVQTIKAGGHGREIRAAATAPGRQHIATGAEDTVVRIWSRTNDSNNSLRCHAVLKRHDTGLHGLAWLGDRCFVSAAGAEELFVWRVGRIPDSAYDGLAVLCASACPDRTADDKTLRLTGMDASGTEKDSLITIALSNSILKTYAYADNSWRLLASGRYTGACPTQVRHLSRPGSQEATVLAAFTDGHLSVWTAAKSDAEASTYRLLRATPVHRNAVKSLDMVRVAGLVVVVTGGDDNALAMTQLRKTGDDSGYEFLRTFRVASAHAAAVTGIRIMSVAEDDTGAVLTTVSCSNDQRVKAWRIFVPDNGKKAVRVQLLDDQSSAVADPADLELLDDRTAMVVGIGMETWDLALN